MNSNTFDFITPPLKIHRVATIAEVKAIDSTPVSYIGFHVDDDAFLGIDDSPFWADDRYLLLDQLPELLEAVVHARPFVECSLDAAEEVVEKMLACGVTLLQLDSYSLPTDDWLAAQQKRGIEIIYGHHYIVPEDDSRFLGLVNRLWPCLYGIELQVFPSERDAWNLISLPEPRLDCLTLDDISYLANQLPLFISLNFTLENCTSIRKALTSLPIKGLSMTLSDTQYGSFHTFGFDELLQILHRLK